MNRYLRAQIEKDLKRKMVFVAGARQVGKTTLARQILGGKDGYLNWDIPEHRAVKKEQKHYHLDWSLVQDVGARFENMVACHLLKWVHHEQDVHGRDLELMYFRDVDRREVDFVIVEGRKPIRLIECKLGDSLISQGLKYMKLRFPDCEAFQISAAGKKNYRSPEGIRVCNALPFLNTLV